MLDGIVAVKTIEREGGVKEVRNYEPKPIIEDDSQFDGDWDLGYGI